MRFFVGLHHPHRAGLLWQEGIPVFISVNALRRFVHAPNFTPGDWIMDSGAFTELSNFGRYRHSVRSYADEARRWIGRGNLLAVVAQDYMCEPFILQRTGHDVETHQYLTIERYDELRWHLADSGAYVMPVLQGWTPIDYRRHVIAYDAAHTAFHGRRRLPEGAWVGVGSVCKRQGSPAALAAILEAILDVRPDLRLHGFGVKTTALAFARVADRLHSADSMAWSFDARMRHRNGMVSGGANCPHEAIRFARSLATRPVQTDLFM